MGRHEARNTTTLVLQLLINIVAAGGAYALVAAGYTIVHSTLKFINFQHGYGGLRPPPLAITSG